MHTSKGAIIDSGAAIARAAEMFGSEAALAAAIGVKRQTLNYWKGSLLNYEKAMDIYVATKGKVDIDDLRPDLRGLTKKFKQTFLNNFSSDETEARTSEKLSVDVTKIKVKRLRKDFGDMRELTDSIKKFGLLVPIEIDLDMTLVNGERRLRAFKKLKKRFIPATMRNYVSPTLSRFLASLCQKPYTLEEKERIKKKLKKEFKNNQELEITYPGLLEN